MSTFAGCFWNRYCSCYGHVNPHDFVGLSRKSSGGSGTDRGCINESFWSSDTTLFCPQCALC